MFARDKGIDFSKHIRQRNQLFWIYNDKNQSFFGFGIPKHQLVRPTWLEHNGFVILSVPCLLEILVDYYKPFLTTLKCFITGLPLFTGCVIFVLLIGFTICFHSMYPVHVLDLIVHLKNCVGEEEDRLGLWRRKCWVDGSYIQESL